MSASVEQVRAAIDAAARGSGFSCKNISWDSVQGNSFGAKPNISDVRLCETSGQPLFTVRCDTWNERLGIVAAKDIAMVTGNERSVTSALEPTTLQDFLQTFGQRAAYVGCTTPSLFEPTLDGVFRIRFQTVFLPVAANQNSFGRSPTQFCTEVRNHQTRSDDDPRNMLLLATPQGTSVQQDTVGSARQYFHSVDAHGTVHRYWLEEESSGQTVGGAQHETFGEQLNAAGRGKAVAVRLGPTSMGTRFNVQMLIQIPLKQKSLETPNRFGFGAAPQRPAQGPAFGAPAAGFGAPPAPAAGFGAPGATGGFGAPAAAPVAAAPAVRSAGGFGAPPPPAGGFGAPAPSAAAGFGPAPTGVSSASRVSRGLEQDTYPGLANKAPERDPSQHGTITVTMYYTVVGGVPSVADVKAAIQDLDQLYKQCPLEKGGAPPAPPCAGPRTMPAPAALPLGVPICPHGHVMHTNTLASAPPQGWHCDGCGGFERPAGPGMKMDFLLKGYGCRPCDFDLCLHCCRLPKCPGQRSLTVLPRTAAPVTLEQQVLTQCNVCLREFARHVASMRGCQSPLCTHPPFNVCEPCLAASSSQ